MTARLTIGEFRFTRSDGAIGFIYLTRVSGFWQWNVHLANEHENAGRSTSLEAAYKATMRAADALVRKFGSKKKKKSG